MPIIFIIIPQIKLKVHKKTVVHTKVKQWQSMKQ